MCPKFEHTESLFSLQIIPFNLLFFFQLNKFMKNTLKGIIFKRKRDSVYPKFGHTESLFSLQIVLFNLLFFFQVYFDRAN